MPETCSHTTMPVVNRFSPREHLSFENPTITEWSLDQQVIPVPSPPWFDRDRVVFLDDRSKPEELLQFVSYAARGADPVSRRSPPVSSKYLQVSDGSMPIGSDVRESLVLHCHLCIMILCMPLCSRLWWLLYARKSYWTTWTTPLCHLTVPGQPLVAYGIT